MSDTSKPVYLRLRDTVIEAILDGQFPDGAMLPSVRSFAVEQGANPLTVAKAYQGLQDDGFVIVKRGIGMFVADGAAARLRQSERANFIENVWPPVAQQIKRLNLDIDGLLATSS
jgi:GntR family transcriptional regulator